MPDERSTFATDSALRAFSRRRPPQAHAFADDRLLTYRYPRERLALAIALAVVVVALVAVSHWSWAGGVALLGLLALTALVTQLSAAQNSAQGAEVTPTQFSELYPIVDELRTRFRMPQTRVFVTQSPIINASSFGFRRPYVVVLNSALVDALDPVELKSVLGHEFGHVKFGHTRVGVLLGGLDTRGVALPFPFNLVALVRDAVFHWWQRSTELSADRAGIIACGRVSKAISAQLKIGVGPSLVHQVNLSDLARQAAGLRGGVGGVEHFVSQLGAAHPFLLTRVQAMLDFVGEPDLDENDNEDEDENEDDIELEPAPAPPVVPATVPAARARLVPLGGGLVHGERWLSERRLLAGRSPSTDLQLHDRAVSRRHFEIVWQADGYVLRDLDSNNGTFVNGKRVRTASLRDGDLIRVGMTELEFILSSSP